MTNCHETVSHNILYTDTFGKYDEEVFSGIILKSNVVYDNNYCSLTFDEEKLSVPEFPT